MKRIVDSLREFLTGDEFNSKLRSYEGKAGIPLPPLAQVQFGVTDPSRVQAGNFAVIVPDSQKGSYQNQSVKNERNGFTVTVALFHQQDKYQNLLEREFAYSSALRDMLSDSFAEFGGFSDVELGGTEFFNNVGPTDFQCTATETEVTVWVDGSDSGNDPFASENN